VSAALNSEIEPEALLTSSEVGELLQVNPSSVKNWVNEGLISAFRTPGGHRRIRVSDLMAFLDQQKIPVPKQLEHVSRRRLLVVDDDPMLLRSMARELRRHESRVQVALVANGIDALLMVGSFKPHLIVLDVFMPDLDGLEVCRRLKANPETKHVGVVVTSAHLTKELERSGMSAGARRCFEKPIDIAAILEELGLVQFSRRGAP
jgi:excisionase family DNA binding protein